jgi:hypothetical protein
MTSKEEPAGIEASLTIKTSFDPSSLSIKILAVIPEVLLFAMVIPITIVSRADELDPAGTVYKVVFDVPTSGLQNLLKSLAIVVFPLFCFLLYL